MGFDNDCILNIQSLAGEYFCAVCRTLVYPNEAMQAPCTHLYCKPCLTYVVSTTHACPYDGYRVTEADSKPLLESNKTLADTIGKIQVHCLYYRTGCTWQGSLSDSTTHGPTCTFGESPVLCNKCGIQLKHRQVQEHAQNCSGVQSQVQQSGGVQDNTSTTATSAPAQTQTSVPTSAGGSSTQAQASQASTTLVPSQNANQTANPAVQPQASQAVALTPEQLYQQQQQYQQQYQQYYQQYPGYDPYQQNYQYYYQYPQAAQQQQTQAYPQPYGQPPQGYVQAQAQPINQVQQQVQPQTQPIVQAQQQVQPQVPTQPQVPAAQLPVQPQVQPAVNAHPQAASVGQAQPHMHGQGQGQGQTQPQTQGQGQAPPSHAPYNQAPPYNQSQPVPQQQLQRSQYPPTLPQMVNPYAQTYPQSQTQPEYSHPQPQMQSQVHSQAPVHPPQQPFPQSAHPPTQNAAMGYQSYPQPQLHPQAQVGAGQPAHAAGAQYPSQMQGQFPSQTAQTRPPQSYGNMPNQQQPAMMAAQGQPPSGPSAHQTPVYPHAQQPGYPIQQRPSVQAAPQQYGQQQSFPGQGLFMQHQPPLAAQLHAQGPPQIPPQPPQNYVQPHGVRPNVPHNYAGRPVGGQAVAHPYAQNAGPAGAAQVRPQQSNQHQPMNSSNQLSSAEQQATQSQQMLSGEKPRDPAPEKGHDKVDRSNEARHTATAYSGQKGDEMISNASNGLAVSAGGNNSNYLSGSKMAPTSDTVVDNHAQEAKLRTKTENGDGFPEGPSGVVGKNTEVQNLKNGAGDSAQPSSSPKPQSKSQAHGANSFPNVDRGRNQQQPMSHGPSAQHKPGVSSMPQSVTYPNNSQQSAVSGHPSNQLRPQGLGHASSGFPAENPSGGMHGPGSGSLSRPGNVNSYQGPPHQTGHPHANPLVGPSFDGNRHDAFRHETEKFAAHRSGHFDGRQPDSQLKPFPHREFEDDFRKLPRPPHMQAGPLANHGTRFPSSGPLDHGFDHDRAFEMDGVNSGAPRSFPPFHPRDVSERQRAFPDDDMRRADFSHADLPGPLAGPGLGRRHMDDLLPRSPRRDYPDFPSRMFAPYGDMGRNDPRAFENSKLPAFPQEPFGNPLQKSRFPAPSRGDLDVAGNLRMGEHFGPNQDLMPSHLQRGGRMGLRSLPLGEPSGFGRPGEFSRIEPPLSGNLPPHILFGDSYGGEKTGLPLVGEPGFRSGFGFPRFAHDDGFHPREMEHFENMRKRKLGSIMCRICKVECGTVDNLELHSQSREHQQKAREVVLSIKHQNQKKQKVPKDRAFFEEGRDGGRPKRSNFQGRGNKR